MALSSAETRQIKAGVVTFAKDLDRLSTSHYGMSGKDLLKNLNTAEGRKQYERLLGAMVQKPVATAAPRPAPILEMGRGAVMTFRAAVPIGSGAIGRGKAAVSFKSAGEKAARGTATKAKRAATAQTEQGLGRKMLNAFHRRICGSTESSQAVKDAIKKAEQEGHKLTDPTVNGISVGAATIVGAAVGSLLTGTLAAVAAPVVGGVALLLMQVGVEGFCDWSNEKPKAKPKGGTKPGAKKKKKTRL